MPDDEPSRNPFVIFKRHVDASVGKTIDYLNPISDSARQQINTASNKIQSEQDQPPPSQPPEPPKRTNVDMDVPDASSNDVLDWPTARLWQRFAFYSPYSPLNLRHLPQPIPHDLPCDVDPDTFTFEDAFEDLLSETSGRQMMDLRRRSEMRLLLREIFPYGEPGYSWLQRLQAQGLLQNDYHKAIDHPRIRYERPRTMEEWVERRRQELLRDWGNAGDRRSQEADKSPSWADWLDKDITVNFGDMARKADRAFKELAQAINESSQRDQSSVDTPKERSSSEWSNEEPETENDLFSVVSSAFAEADKSLSTFIRCFTGGTAKTDFSTSFEKQEKLADIEGDDNEPGRTLRSTQEHVDEFGNLHTKTEIKRFNADGQEIGRETHYSIRPVEQSQNTDDPESPPDAEQSPKSVESQKPSGWFWK